MPSLTIYFGTNREFTHRWQGDQCTIGRATANDLPLDEEAVSSFHARIERRGGEFWLVDLNSTNGTFVNGVRIRETPLKIGDKIFIGEVVPLRFEFQLRELQGDRPFQPEVTIVMPSATPPPGPIPMQSALQPIGQGSSLMPAGVQCPACQAMIPFAVNFCPRCGFNLAQSGLPAFPPTGGGMGGFVRPQESAGSSSGMLPLVALLCGLSVIGFPFAIILGLVAVAQIRRQGGFSADRKQALAGVLLGVFWLMVLTGLGGWWLKVRYDARRQNQSQQAQETARRETDVRQKQIAENEVTIVDALKGLARAQRLAKVIRFKDPNNTGVGQYLFMDELAQLPTTLFSRELASGHTHGYRFTILDPTAENYLALAEPESPGVTGKRTFSVDASGILRGQDLETKTYAQANKALPVISEIKSAFDGMDDAIAKEAIAYAKELANRGRIEDCRRILDTIPEQFAMTTAAQELLALKKSVDPFIVEAQADARYAKAKAAVAAGDLKLALGLLKDITELYPTYSKIATVTDDLTHHQTALAQKLDKEAKALFEQAAAAERDGKPEAALDFYVQIEKNYPETTWAKRISELRPALQNSIREKGAEELFAQARTLSVNENYRDIVNNLEQLMRNYADTTYVRDNSGPIVTLYQKALAQQYRALAIEQMNAGRDTDALARLEDACSNNADLRPALKDLFLKLCLRVGQRRMDEGDEREALTLYRKYLALEPERSEVSPALLARLNYAVAKSEFSLGNYTNAAQNLIAARAAYDKEPEYNDLAGAVLVALGKYDDAIPHFDRAIAAKPDIGNYRARRGYAALLHALRIEQEAFNAVAGYLGSTPTAPPAATTNALPEPLATSPDAASATNFAPVFATTLPLTVAGTRPDLQVKYDAMASQNLLDEILDLLQQIQEAGNGAAITRTTKRPATNKSGATNATATSTSSRDINMRDRINRIRSGVELGNAVSAIHQKILDNNSRKTRAVTALRRMTTLLTSANRDLADAINLGADRAAELTDILKATRQQETILADATTKITTYLGIEMETIDRAYLITENLYRNFRVQHIGSPTDPTLALETYFAKLFNRRDFDEGIQRLREAAAIRVPLEGYALFPTPVAPPSPLPAGPATAPKPKTAPLAPPPAFSPTE